MKIIGVTGGSGSGKSSLSSVWQIHGALALDADKIYHALTRESDEMKNALIAGFGKGIYLGGVLDRVLLAGIVFGNADELKKLNAITHPIVVSEIKQRLSLYNGSTVAVDAISLFESGISELCDFTVGVIAPRETRISRIAIRDRISRGRATARIDAQKDDSFFESHCNVIVLNNSTENALRSKAEALYNGLII